LLRVRYGDWRWTPASSYPEQTTWRLDHPDRRSRYLKIKRQGCYPTLAGEATRAQWARPYLPVPEVIESGDDRTVEWMATSALDGRPATDGIHCDPATVVAALGEGLRRFHDRAPVDRCPFNFDLNIALAHVERRVATGLIDPSDAFNDDHRHLDLPAALALLDRLRPADEDLVVCHGDYCPPNILLADGQAVGYVDVGELGVADRWWDLAVATWSVTWNFGPGLETRLLAAYGAAPDRDRQTFYRLLYDLVS
jgi:kanamycin kinase